MPIQMILSPVLNSQILSLYNLYFISELDDDDPLSIVVDSSFVLKQLPSFFSLK